MKKRFLQVPPGNILGHAGKGAKRKTRHLGGFSLSHRGWGAGVHLPLAKDRARAKPSGMVRGHDLRTLICSPCILGENEGEDLGPDLAELGL